MPGALVLVRNSVADNTISSKNQSRWLGPFVVIRRTFGGSYVLAELNGTISKLRFAAFCVKMFHQREGLSFELEKFISPIALKELKEELVKDREYANTYGLDTEGEEDLARLKEERDELTKYYGAINNLHHPRTARDGTPLPQLEDLSKPQQEKTSRSFKTVPNLPPESESKDERVFVFEFVEESSGCRSREELNKVSSSLS
ncbi:hypothetical protein FRC14_006580 [Serendipita sp. 396]|nr:hypothetical protein FRC14_006580 [Serendipita sp. 396]KAG8779842.1 hypothetical protein FRC15_009909 [Serendipita sp. 397]KAG8796679.1 hypothetical protein FRC16_009532 [Serendipita sp. 398]KAG8822805.1 hypothetical protein FRC19_005208 [Serendipita sp. 401]KAG8866227.1 hypothetical protein FRC20_008935 [Serendipita sp. 405]KAG9052978.1 hypothetical protein FS842_008955 [Serendipita sp. 407]